MLSFKYLLSTYCVPGTVVNPENTAGNETNTDPHLTHEGTEAHRGHTVGRDRA